MPGDSSANKECSACPRYAPLQSAVPLLRTCHPPPHWATAWRGRPRRKPRSPMARLTARPTGIPEKGQGSKVPWQPGPATPARASKASWRADAAGHSTTLSPSQRHGPGVICGQPRPSNSSERSGEHGAADARPDLRWEPECVGGWDPPITFLVESMTLHIWLVD